MKSDGREQKKRTKEERKRRNDVLKLASKSVVSLLAGEREEK